MFLNRCVRVLFWIGLECVSFTFLRLMFSIWTVFIVTISSPGAFPRFLFQLCSSSTVSDKSCWSRNTQQNCFCQCQSKWKFWTTSLSLLSLLYEFSLYMWCMGDWLVTRLFYALRSSSWSGQPWRDSKWNFFTDISVARVKLTLWRSLLHYSRIRDKR